MHLKTILFSYFLFLLAASDTKPTFEPTPDTRYPKVLRAVRGREARLPCGQAKVFLDGPDSYVIWTRNDCDILYRFPNEHVDNRDGRRGMMFGTPCEAGICPEDTSLFIRRASDQDGGLYRCRIHLQASPSIDYVYELKLVNPTGVPRIYSGDGELLNQGFVGPISLQSDLILICEVEDKGPFTVVFWRRNGVLVNRTETNRMGSNIQVEVQLYNVSRGELAARYECNAQNSDVSEPLVASVAIKMYMPPLSVEIRMNDNTDFEAGQPRVVDCVVVGCMPPPSIIWYLGTQILRPYVHKELNDGNYTVSSLTLAPSLRYDRNELVCRAYNTLIPDGVFQDKVTINVGYRPVCGMTHEPRIGAVMGEPEVIICVVDSSPEPLQISWTFADGSTVDTSYSKVAGDNNYYSSRLDWMARGGEIGILKCSVKNKFGAMKKPCAFNVSAGGPPDMPRCKLTKIYPNSLRVHCEKGWDGGRPQTVHLDFLDEGTGLKNLTDEAGQFYVQYIDEKKNITAVLYATNSRGKSANRRVYLRSLVAVSEAEHNHVKASWMPYIQVSAVTVALLVFLVACLLGVKILLVQQQTGNTNPDIVPRSDGIFHREPDFIRDDRLLGLTPSTCITVNTLTGCQNQYSPSPKPACRVLVGHGALSSADTSSQHSYYV